MHTQPDDHPVPAARSLARSRVIVTGAAGFVGANVARRLVADGHDVNLFVGPKTDNWRLDDLDGSAVTWEVALEDRDAVQHAMAGCRPDLVFHLATHGAYSSQKSLERMVSSNIVGTMNLVEAALKQGVSAFVNTGSSSEYGYKDHAPTETEWVDPNSHYAVTKAAATMYCRYTSLATGTPVTTLRLYSVYGPWEEPTRLIPRLVTLGLAGRLPPLVSPSVARDYVHVDDVVEACLRAARSDQPLGGVYNVGTGTQTTLAQLVQIARDVLRIDQQPSWGSMANRSWDTDTWVCDPALIRQELGWSPEHTVQAGLASFARWLQTDAPTARYLCEGLPASH